MELEVELHWSELLMVMTEDDGRIRATEQSELMLLWIDEFFIKLLVFRDRMEKRIEELKNNRNAK